MISLTRRLALGLLLAGLAVMFLLAHGSVLLFDHAFRDYLGERLREDAEGIVAEALDEQDRVDLDRLPFRESYSRVYAGSYFSLRVDGGEEIRSRSLWDHRLPNVGEGLAERLLPGPEGQALLVWSGAYSRAGHEFEITTALDYTPVTQRLNWLRLSIWLLGGLLAVLLVVIQQHVIRLGMRPLGRLRSELALINDGHRMKIETQVPEEIEPVVVELNHQLERIEKVLNRSRDGISNLGHALKTPLAVMETLLARRELSQHPELRDGLRNRLDDIHRLVERELQRARLDTRDNSHTTRFHPDTELPPLIDTLGEIYHHIHFDYRIDGVPNALPWDGEDMLEVLGNLLDNAGKWAKSEARLTLSVARGQLIMEVDDDGPGIIPEYRDEVIHRGTRLDEKVAGHGLGLGIVEQVVAYHGGEMALADSPLGGLKVRIQLPMPIEEPERQPRRRRRGQKGNKA